MTVHATNAAAKRGLAACSHQLVAIDNELSDLGDAFLEGRVTELFVKVREIDLRKRREAIEATRKAMLSAIKDF